MSTVEVLDLISLASDSHTSLFKQVHTIAQKHSRTEIVVSIDTLAILYYEIINKIVQYKLECFKIIFASVLILNDDHHLKSVRWWICV